MVGYVINPSLYNRIGDRFYLYPPAAPADNEAVFTADPSSWDSLATVPVADEAFETNSGVFRMRPAQIQYAPRIVNILGTIPPHHRDDECDGGDYGAAKFKEDETYHPIPKRGSEPRF